MIKSIIYLFFLLPSLCFSALPQYVYNVNTGTFVQQASYPGAPNASYISMTATAPVGSAANSALFGSGSAANAAQFIGPAAAVLGKLNVVGSLITAAQIGWGIGSSINVFLHPETVPVPIPSGWQSQYPIPPGTMLTAANTLAHIPANQVSNMTQVWMNTLQTNTFTTPDAACSSFASLYGPPYSYAGTVMVSTSQYNCMLLNGSTGATLAMGSAGPSTVYGCPAGYVPIPGNSTMCNLANPALVSDPNPPAVPMTGPCTDFYPGGIYPFTIGDCSASPLGVKAVPANLSPPAGQPVTPDTLTITAPDGTGLIFTRDPVTGLQTLKIASPTPDLNTKTSIANFNADGTLSGVTQTLTQGVGASQSTVSQPVINGSNTGNAPTIDVSKLDQETTQQSILQQLQTMVGVSPVPVDPSASTNANIQQDTKATTDLISSIPASESMIEGLFSTFVWTPPPATCTNPVWSFRGSSVSPDLCFVASLVRDVLGFLLALFAAWEIYMILFRKEG